MLQHNDKQRQHLKESLEAERSVADMIKNAFRDDVRFLYIF